jgi:hypothetical protein
MRSVLQLVFFMMSIPRHTSPPPVTKLPVSCVLYCTRFCDARYTRELRDESQNRGFGKGNRVLTVTDTEKVHQVPGAHPLFDGVKFVLLGHVHFPTGW